MKTVIQKVNHASVIINDLVYSNIENGYVLLLGITHEDTSEDISYIINKILKLSLFRESREKGYYHKNIFDVDGEILVISQFTLYGSLKKGRKPSFTKAASPETAEKLYNEFVEELKMKFPKVKTGKFAEYMKVSLENDGPSTFIIDTKNK